MELSQHNTNPCHVCPRIQLLSIDQQYSFSAENFPLIIFHYELLLFLFSLIISLSLRSPFLINIARAHSNFRSNLFNLILFLTRNFLQPNDFLLVLSFQNKYKGYAIWIVFFLSCEKSWRWRDRSEERNGKKIYCWFFSWYEKNKLATNK